MLISGDLSKSYFGLQYSHLGRTAASVRLNTTFRGLAPSPSSGFCLRMGTELVPETLYSNELTRLCARENYIESCRRESFKTYISVLFLGLTEFIVTVNNNAMKVELYLRLTCVFFFSHNFVLYRENIS
jgi:hypothetical protein